MRVMKGLVLIACAAVAACGDGGTEGPPEPATLNVAFTTPGGSEGAVLLTITGPTAVSVQAVGSGTVLITRPVTGGVTAAVFGTLASGDIVRFTIPDGKQKSAYMVSLVEVAGTDNSIRQTAGYSVSLH